MIEISYFRVGIENVYISLRIVITQRDDIENDIIIV